MPSLSHLPQEILYLIARFVGSDYLRARAGNLALFKNWWRVARVVAYEDLTLSIKTITRYLEVSKSVQSLVQRSVKTLEIMASEVEGDHLKTSTMAEIMNDHTTLTISGVLQSTVNESLVRLASQLTHMPRMESFSLVLFVYFEPSPVQDSFSFNAISTLLSNLPTALSSLTIDNSGTPSSLAPERQEGRNHLCSLLLDKSFTPHLRHLRIRARNLCPEILQMISSDQYTQLESLIINLSLRREEFPWMSKIFYAHFCSGFQTNGKDLYSSLVDAAKAVLPCLPCIKTLKIIRHKYPAEDLVSYDVVSDQYVILPPSIDWKAMDYVNDNENLSPDCSEQSVESSSGTESVDELPWLDLGIERTLG